MLCSTSWMISVLINCCPAPAVETPIRLATSGVPEGHRAARDETDETTMLVSPTWPRRPVIQSLHAGSYGIQKRVLVPSHASL